MVIWLKGGAMKVLGILGSPRVGGNSDIILDKVLSSAEEQGASAEKIVLNEMDLAPCQEIEYENVTEEGLSMVKDDFGSIFRKIKESDSIIVASPVFFGSVSAQLKIMIDRFQCVWVSKNTLKKDIFIQSKKGAFICTSGTDRKDFFEDSRKIIKHFFATVNIKYDGEIFCPGVDQKGKAAERGDILDKALVLGREMATK